MHDDRNNVNGLFFITDLHVTSVCRSRVDIPMEAIGAKLQWVVNYCNEHQYALLLGGDVFDTPTVGFEVYNELVSILQNLSTPCFGVWGNHDMLYRSHTNDKKCALYALAQAHVVSLFSSPVDLFIGDTCIRLTGSLPLCTASVPQVLVYHGFLEIKDGAFTVSIADLLGCASEAVVLLGHDHAVYDDVRLSNGVLISRCGSFYRNRREDTCRRGVYGSLVTVKDGSLSVSRVAIPCKSFEEIFVEKGSLSGVSDDLVDYTSLIKSLGAAVVGRDITFEEALQQVASSEEVEYIKRKMND